MTGEESAGVLFIMISPTIITVRRVRKTVPLRRRSIRDISRQHLKKTAAHYRALADEIDSGRGTVTPRERLNIASQRQPEPTQ